MGWSSGGFSPAANDGNQGAVGFVGSIDSVTNAAGLQSPAGSMYSGGTVFNRSPTNWLRAELSFLTGFTPAVATDVYQLVPPNGAASFSFDSDVVERVKLQIVDAPAAGTLVRADAAVVSAAVSGVVSVGLNLVSG